MGDESGVSDEPITSVMLFTLAFVTHFAGVTRSGASLGARAVSP
jgi:hypothetical protein